MSPVWYIGQLWTEAELLGGDFSQVEIDTHFPAALEQAGVKRLGDTL